MVENKADLYSGNAGAIVIFKIDALCVRIRVMQDAAHSSRRMRGTRMPRLGATVIISELWQGTFVHFFFSRKTFSRFFLQSWSL